MTIEDTGLLVAAIALFFELLGYLGIRPSFKRTTSRDVSRINRWSRRAYETPLAQIDLYLERVAQARSGPLTGGQVGAMVLQRWAWDLILTASAAISPHSQGKANLFVVHQNNAAARRLMLRSHTFVGAFPVDQLTDEGTYRDIEVDYSDATRSPSDFVAAMTLWTGEFEYQRLAFRKKPVSWLRGFRKDRPPPTGDSGRIERQLGTTHIVGIPLRQPGAKKLHELVSDLQNLSPGQPVAITVDLRIPLLYRLPPLQAALTARLEGRVNQISSKARALPQALGTDGEEKTSTLEESSP